MQPQRHLPMLYELALAAGSGSCVEDLLSRFFEALQRHTGLPIAVALRSYGADHALVSAVTGTNVLRVALPLPVPTTWFEGPVAELRGAEARVPGLPELGSGFTWKLPIAGFGALVLFGPDGFDADLPAAEELGQVLQNLSRSLSLCAQSATLLSLRESEDDLHRAQAVSRTGSWLFDIASGTARASPEAYRLVGLPPETPWTRDTFLSRVLPEDRPRLEETFAKLLAEGEQEFDYRIQVDREVRWMHGSLVLERAGDGPPLRVRGSLTDVTRWRETAEELERHEALYATLVGRGAFAFLLIDPRERRFVEFNDAVCKILGYTREELAGMSIDEIQSADVPLELQVARFMQVEETGALELETNYRGKDGKPRELWLSVRRIELGGTSYHALIALDIGARKRMELELRERLKELTCLLEVQRLLEAAPPRDELCQRTVGLLVPAMQFPEVTVATLDLDGRHYASGDPTGSVRSLSADVHVRRAARGRLVVHYTADREFLLPEEQNLVDGVARAIGLWLEQVEADEALRRSEADYRLLTDNAADVIWKLDAETLCLTYVSPSCERLTGHTPDEMRGITLDQTLTPAAVEKFRQHLSEHPPALGRAPESLAVEQRHKDGSVVLVELNYRWVQGEAGRIEAVGVSRDVTERNRARAEAERLSQVVAQSPESIVITGLDGRIQYVNDAFVRTTGYTREEAIGRNPRLLQSGKTPPSTFVAMWRALERGDAWKGELINRRKDGTEFVELAVLAPMRQGDRITHYVAIKQDVTEMRRLSAEVEHQRQQAQVAEAASRSKSAFLANMSHEMRTPMNAILGLTHLVRRETTVVRHQEQLDKVTSAARHLLSIINDLLDLSKIEAGKVVLEDADFDVRRVVSEVCDLVADKAASKRLDLRVDLGDVPPALRGDSGRVRQLLLNFLGNAVKFTDAGSVTVRARVISLLGERVRVRFEVVDTGIGLSEPQRARLFQSFEQADASTTRKYGGTGLGLAISRHLALLMGGEVGCESEPGKGSTFWFEAPFSTATRKVAAADTPDAPAAELACAAYAQGRGLQVLLAEDNDLNAEVALELVGAVGIMIDRAHDGVETLERARFTRYDLVLMDVQMPEMNGLEATRRLRALPAYAHTPILAMTASAFDEDREECLRAGMDDFVLKPVLPEQLYRALLYWLAPRDADGATISARPASAASSLGSAEPGPDPRGGQAASLPAGLLGLGDIDGLDVRVGLRSVGHRVPAFLRLLGQFRERHAADLALLAQQLRSGDRDAGRLTAHALKGVAGTLGMSALTGLAERVESAFREDARDETILELAASADAELQRLVRALESAPVPRPSSAPAPARAVPSAALRARLAELRTLLQTDDWLAQERFTELRPALAELQPAATEQLRRQIETFAYTEALRTLDSFGPEPAQASQ